MTDHVPVHAHRLSARGRLVPWILAIVFVLQVLFAPQHHHDTPAKTSHCAACALHAQPHAGPPATVAPPASPGWHIVHCLFFTAVAARRVAGADYLLPPAHAPPRLLPTY
jgi:hypothetical protein